MINSSEQVYNDTGQEVCYNCIAWDRWCFHKGRCTQRMSKNWWKHTTAFDKCFWWGKDYNARNLR